MIQPLAMRDLGVFKAPAQKRWSLADALGRWKARAEKLFEPPGKPLAEALAMPILREVAEGHLNMKFAGRPPIFDLHQ